MKKFATVLLAAALASTAAIAQDYPSRIVKFIVPFGPGGPADVAARLISKDLQESLKQSFIVENRTGAGAVIGTAEAAKAAPDGYTLLIIFNTQTANESLIPTRNYELMRDFVAISPINQSDLVIVAHPSVNAKTVPELIALANRSRAN